MINEEQLEKITLFLINNVAENTKIQCDTDDIIGDLSAYTLSLHNLLYEAVTGKPYDYMLHWTNKIGVNYYNNKYLDHYFDDLIGRNKEEGR